ncbi:MAG TPA: hypothetical protein VNX01_16840 [Bacteroidia bacterium]|nr:hypothetical protein [Bacteroidia bacterium]
MKTLATSIIAAALFFSGCKKGDTGPAGSTGANGSANITTQTYTVTSWTSQNPFYYTNISVSALSAVVQNQAAVEVFLSIDTAKHWMALPYTFNLAANPAFMGFTWKIL